MARPETGNDGTSGGPRYRFGEVVVDAAAHMLVRDGQLQTVEPKAFAVLLALLRRAGELVPRDELLDEVWGHRHVTPGVLTRAIAQLRHALDDDFHHPRYIHTQHALGYRFIAVPECDHGPAVPAQAAVAADRAAAYLPAGTAVAAPAPAEAPAGAAPSAAVTGEPDQPGPTGAHPPPPTAAPVAGPDVASRLASDARGAGWGGRGGEGAATALGGPSLPTAAVAGVQTDPVSVGSASPPVPGAERTAAVASAAPAVPATADRRSPPGPAGAAAVASRTRAWAAPGTAGWALAALLVLALGAAGWWLWRGGTLLPRAGVAPPGQASIAVLPFTSLSSARDDRYFAEGLAVEMHDALAGVPGLQVVASRPGEPGLGDRGDIQSLGKRLGVATVLDASVRRDGPRMRISARLADTRSGVTLWAGSYDRQTTDVFALQTEIANEVVQALLGVLPGGGSSMARRLAPTHNIVAYDAYLKGVQRLQDPGNDQDLQVAIGHFRQALSADPVFARAQAGICRAEIARFESTRDAAAFERAETACMRASSMDPGLREVSLALGEMYRARGDHAKAIVQYTRALDDIALRPAAYVGLARAQGALGRNELALDYFERARQLRPGDASILRERGYHQYLAGDVAAAIASYRDATALAPDDAGLWSSLGGLYLAAGDAARAGDAFQHSLAIEPNYAALSNYGSLKYEAGAYAEAATLYRRAADLDPTDFRIWGNIGDALAALPATAHQAREPYRRAAQMAERYVGIKADDAQALALLCWYRANLGEPGAARELLQRAESMATEPGEVAFWGAQALALLGDTEGARARLQRAQAADIPLQRIRASPLLRRVLQDARAGVAPRSAAAGAGPAGAWAGSWTGAGTRTRPPIPPVPGEPRRKV